jgi:pimeloyl-ACP methyl ester carboxylesterase/DNA-binding CsgD family transcriptional regulator
LASGAASYAVTAFKPGELSWTHTAQAYGLTMAESQLVAALARHGDLQLAATERGVAYETARKFVASAMRKTGTKRQTALIRQTLMVAAGDLPDAQNLGLIARDLFGLTPRQADLAVLLAHGATRERAASILGTTDSAAKSDLKIVFQACGVASAVDLSRLMTEINALKGLASACDVLIRSHSSASEPLRLVPRTWGEGRIAVSDHGPANGTPVVILHSNVSGRHHPRSFIKALRENGFRPITFDRAGYGLTTMIKGHPTATGVKDLEDVLDALGLAKVAVLARCNTGSAVATAAQATGRVTGGVLLWPEAVPHPDRPKTRSGDWVRAIYAHFPEMAEGMTRLMCRRTSAASIEKQWRYSARNVAADLALLDDPAEREDLIRGAQQAVYGMHGFLNEALAHGNGAADPARIADAARWTLIYSPGYEPGDLENAIAHWSERLTGATVTYYEDGGHFMHVTNTQGVIEALKRAVA